jgi:hypothetical protein
VAAASRTKGISTMTTGIPGFALRARLAARESDPGFSQTPVLTFLTHRHTLIGASDGTARFAP